MSTHPNDIKPCSRCGRARATRNGRPSYCMECRGHQTRSFANWMEHGACKDPAFDPEWWWPETSDPAQGQTPMALSICHQCPVRNLCLSYAIQHKEREGIWGGLMPAPRNALAAHYERKAC